MAGIRSMVMARALFGKLAALRRDRRGNVLMLFAFALLPIVFSTGMGIDYARAMRTQTKMNAAADASALAAVSKQVMAVNAVSAAYIAQQMFIAQTQGMVGNGGLVINFYDPTQLVVTVVDSTPSGSTAVKRTATVSYVAKSTNAFASILGMKTLNIRGTSATTASTAPNIDFYMLLDASSSMAFPTTSAGISTLKTATGGCAFACHSTNDATANGKDGKSHDYYGVARSYGLSLRVDEEGSATQQLMSVAKSTSSTNKAAYQMSISTFSEANTFNNIQSLTKDLDAAGAKAATVQTSLYYSNGCPTSSRCNNDTDTGSSDAFAKLNKLMPDPGNGTNANGDKPQEIMFVVTDGMRDEARSDGKPEVVFDNAKCDAIKNRGIRIAILYTEYLPEAINNDDWSTNPAKGNVYNRLPQIEPALTNCASSGLYYKVTTDQDISTALNQLFQKAVATAHLTQ